ncbi:MAG: DNA-processing protein DprA, partial [Bifidobacterium mongoliense]|nr:DNA-processing protein DprA [Bifidobacterium mongoliense]
MTRHPTTGPPDHQTVSRALLTHCIDSADALMFATMKGSGDATEVARLLCAIHAGDTGRDDLERLFARGLVRWGRRVTPSAIQAFRKALVRWLTRLDTLPCLDTEPLGDHFTNHGT